MKNSLPAIIQRWRAVLTCAAALPLLWSALAVMPQAAAAQSVTYTFNNQSSRTIREIYMSSSSVSSWGPDRLGVNLLTAGQSLAVRNLPPGLYDIRVVDQNRNTCIRMQVPVNENTEWVITNEVLANCRSGVIPQGALDFTFVNRTPHTIREIYMSSSSDPNWGPDRLGARILPVGESLTVRNIAPGNYDIKLVAQDNSVCERRNVPVARTVEWVVTCCWPSDAPSGKQ